jgi:hypothetical protein
MPINGKETLNKILKYTIENKVWNSIFSNPFMLAIMVSLCMILLFIIIYNSNNSIHKNLFTFSIYAIAINTIFIMLHDMVYSDSIKKIYDTSNLEELHNKKYTYELGGKFDNNLIKINHQNGLTNSQNNLNYSNNPNNLNNEQINNVSIDDTPIDDSNSENKVSLY